MFRFGRNSAAGCRIIRRLRENGRDRNRKYKFQYGERLYFETGSSYISTVNWDISTKFGWLIDVEKWIWRHISAVGVSIWTKFSSLMQNNMRITANWSRSKPEVEFQYGGRLYFETGICYISAANGDISTKFGLLIDFGFLKAVTSTNTKPEVVFSGRGRHLKKRIWRQISQWLLDFDEIR